MVTVFDAAGGNRADPPTVPSLIMPRPTERSAALRRALPAATAAGLLTLAALASGGCAIGQLVGGMAESARRAGKTTVAAQYKGLAGRDFAVIVAADRAIQADFPDLVPLVTREVTKRLIEGGGTDEGAGAGASGYVPADEVLKFQYQRPGWVAMQLDEVARELEAQRLVYIDLRDFALTDPGNPYVWNGAAAGVVSVVEPDSAAAGDFRFSKPIRVTFPDTEGLGPEQVPRAGVYGELARRFIHRASWLFYGHEEPNIIKY